MGEIKSIYEVLKSLNPIIFIIFTAIIIYILWKNLPKILEKKHNEYTSIFTELEKINERLNNIQNQMESNNQYTKELYVYELERDITRYRDNLKKNGEKPSQSDINELYKKWDRIEKLGDGYQEVKDSLDNLKDLMFS